MARYRSRRTVVLAGCLVSCVLYLLTAYHYQTLSLSGSWSGSAVKRVRSWEGHRQLSLLVVVPSVCGENLEPTSEDRCLQHISRACRDFSSRGCIIKKGVGQSDACEQTLLHQKGSSDIKHAYVWRAACAKSSSSAVEVKHPAVAAGYLHRSDESCPI
jgi:hypothetical protein